MTQKTNKKILVAIPILAAILVGSFGFSNAFAEKFPQTGDILAFTAETQGWAVINGEALPAGISLLVMPLCKKVEYGHWNQKL